MKSTILNSKVIVCAGSGGVGKTTVAASMGCYAASLGQKVLVLTIDPAKRLKTILGLGDLGEVVKVPGQNFSGELFAGTINSEVVFNNFIKEASKSDKTAERILNNLLYKQLSTTLSGSEEFTSIVELYNNVESQNYDLVILDTPPTQHAIDFLQAPERIYTLFQSSVTKWFSERAVNQNIFSKIINKGTNLALMALHKVTGSHFMDELFDFFLSLKDIQGHISKKCEDSSKLLKKPDTTFVLVSSCDQAKFFETRDFTKYLNQESYHLDSVIVNRAYPQWFEAVPEDAAAWLESLCPENRASAEKMLGFYRERIKIYDKLTGANASQLRTYKVPEMAENLTGIEALTEFACFMEEK